MLNLQFMGLCLRTMHIVVFFDKLEQELQYNKSTLLILSKLWNKSGHLFPSAVVFTSLLVLQVY